MAAPINRAAPVGGTAEDIVDRAAELLARHGPAYTSLQAVADAVGVSKTTLLRRFPAKAALLATVTDQCLTVVRAIRSAADATPLGPDRDHEVLGRVVLLATSEPGHGLFSLLVRLAAHESEIREALFAAFGSSDRPERDTRVLATLGAVAAASRIRHSCADDEMRRRLISLGCDTLGHRAC